MQKRVSLEVIALAALVAFGGGCDKSGGGAPEASKPAEKPAAGGKCPAGSTGDGTYDKPCVASGDTRLVPLKYVSSDDNYIVFDAKNNGPYEVIGGQRDLWIYDASGKRLDITIPNNPPMTHTGTSGGMTPTVKPGETKQVKFFLDKKSRPAGAATYQAEFQKVEMSTTGGTPDFVWTNPGLLKGGERPMSK
jgi:hypothetical protein